MNPQTQGGEGGGDERNLRWKEGGEEEREGGEEGRAARKRGTASDDALMNERT